MTNPTNTLPPAGMAGGLPPGAMSGALMSTLVQLGALDRGELTVLAAAAQALAAARPQPALPQQAPGPEAPCRQARGGRMRHRSSRRPDPCDAPPDIEHQGRHSRSIIGSDAISSTATAAGAGSASPDAAARGDVATGDFRLSGRGRMLACAVPLVDPELFVSRAYRSRLEHLEQSAALVSGLLYAAGCDGLLVLARRLDEPLYKVGTTEGATTDMRMSMLGATRYGSVVRDGHDWRGETGFERWWAVDLPMIKPRGPGSPVRPALKAISYQRPASLSHRILDRAVAAALAPAGLAAFAASPKGRAACRERALDPTSLDRYSPAPLGCPQGRYEQARELVLLGPRADADRLAAVLEWIIAAHVMGWDIDTIMPAR